MEVIIMGFAERNGFVQEKAIQIDDIDTALRNRLYNEINRFRKTSPFFDEELKYVVDKLGYRVESTMQRNWHIIEYIFQRNTNSIPWYMPYEIIELFFESKRDYCRRCNCECYERGACDYIIWFKTVSDEINMILEQEKAGYRFLDDKFVNIVNEEELEEVSNATQSSYESVNTHFKKALFLYSDRKNPDYENSIKESISAVEAMCCIITGATGSQATLGNTLKKLEKNGVVIHNAMKVGFEKMYGYTSDADGIRHGGIDFTNAPAEDAKYMLISCSAFVNYLIEKFSRI
jgi:hypothetical protein